ncbi:Ni,Fe-hydrogenase I small subunit [Hahella sp. CCB-MM4]|uniref:carbohydrate binding domain-containing protein n=1 Tax=Hahella sp. (strain CCB-MM4) TaxID=1926491 RepID=UPI000B9C41B5|nr:carbohydrate binding domain-containing protein [Hahella sp. CCB-MM4]OZG73007.1 Ni,Fe-hydrogenase I small subunit [Hahella sp. CCB-MM4]
MKKKLSCALGAFIMSAGIAHAENVVDVLVLYTDEALQTQNGRDIAARAAAYIEFSNQAYANSNVDMKLRLVGLENLDAGYTRVNGSNLDAFRNNREVASLRQRYGADLVTLLNLRQPMSGGYVCGIGYVPPGNSSSGTLYSNAPSLAFSLVGVDCGLNTFSHELGHNMSLGHSYAQNTEGGTWSWARGHGVYGTFSTIMAYPQSYGTYNQLQQFSNPRQVKCEGQACGVDMNRSDGADAATNLVRLGSQIASFVPTVVDNGDDGDDGDNGGDDGGDGNLPVCNKPNLENNLVEDGDFNDLSSWENFSQAGQLSQDTKTKECKDNILKVTNRSAFYSGPFQSLTGKLQAGKQYRVTAKIGLGSNGSRDNARMALQVKDGAGFRYQYLPKVSVTSSEMTDYDQTFTVEADDSLSSIGLLVYGPQAGLDLLVDEVKIEEVGSGTTAPGSKEIYRNGFEQSTQGWGRYFGGSLALSRTAKDGNYSLASYNRYYWYTGPALDVNGLMDSGNTYKVNADVYLKSNNLSSDDVEFWLYMVDDNGPRWKKLSSDSIPVSSWQNLQTEINVEANGAITQMRLHVIGPDPYTRIYIDNLVITK